MARVLQSSVIVDEMLFDFGERLRLSPRTETLDPGVEYEVLADLVIPNSPSSPIPVCVVSARGHLYMVVKKALENASNIAGKHF